MKFFCWLLVLVCCGCSSMRYSHGIPNFKRVAPGIYRGGQPTAEGWRYLAGLGITHDLKLNCRQPDFAAWAFGITVQDDPITLWQQTFGEPSPGQLQDAISSIGPGTFIHCTHGQDRTGLIVALWRVRACGWSVGAAEAEMLSNGFHPLLRGLYWAWQDNTKDK